MGSKGRVMKNRALENLHYPEKNILRKLEYKQSKIIFF